MQGVDLGGGDGEGWASPFQLLVIEDHQQALDLRLRREEVMQMANVGRTHRRWQGDQGGAVEQGRHARHLIGTKVKEVPTEDFQLVDPIAAKGWRGADLGAQAVFGKKGLHAKGADLDPQDAIAFARQP